MKYFCQFFHADAWVCMAEEAGRRYDWVEYEDGTLLGSKGTCVNKIKVRAAIEISRRFSHYS